jgi:hypothetical protein
LLPYAADLVAADERLRPRLDPAIITAVVAGLPDEWLDPEDEVGDADGHREAYVRYLSERLNGPRAWLTEAIAARREGSAPLSVRQTHRADRVV